MKNVEIFKGFWNVDIVKSNPHKLFIFGDNDIGKGKGGQAIIRDLPNAMGIPTKKLPNNSQYAYYIDEEIKENIKKINKSIQKILKEFLSNPKYEILVFPEAGLGTGLAKLNICAPKTLQILNTKLNSIFKIFEQNDK
jgi:hypothetical protein